MWTQVDDQLPDEDAEDSSSSSSSSNSMMPGAAAEEACLVPPGYMLPADGGVIVECPTGTYKEVRSASSVQSLQLH
jgi:hypothetical protein